MLTFQETMLQIGMLREQGISYGKICESLDPTITPRKACNLYLRYFRPFSDEFQFIIKELKWYHLAKHEEECRTLLYLVLSTIKKKAKFRNVKLLTPIIAYVVFRLKGEIIKVREFCQVSNITFSDFKEGLLTINPTYLECSKRDRDLIKSIKSEFNPDPIREIREFYLESLKALNISSKFDGSIDEFTSFYQSIQEKIIRYSRYKTLEALGPILLYMFLKTKEVLVALPEFLDLFQLSYHGFTLSLKNIILNYPDYILRDKTSIVKKYIVTILKSFYPSNEALYSSAFSLHDHFHVFLQHAKEEVIAAVICVLTMISCDLPGITMSDICKKAGVRQSTLKKHFSEKIFPYLGIPDTITLKPAFPFIKREIQKKILLEKAIVKEKISIPAIPPTINSKSIFEYLEEIVNIIQEKRISGVRQDILKEIVHYLPEIKLNINEIVRILQEKGLYEEEAPILGTAIYLSCPFIPLNVASSIISHSLRKRCCQSKISLLLREISLQKIQIRNIFLPFKQAGRVLKQGRTDIECTTCGNFIYLLRYADDVIITACKQCLQKRVICNEKSINLAIDCQI